jgi:nickel-type superoxide dismutase maturation protease
MRSTKRLARTLLLIARAVPGAYAALAFAVAQRVTVRGQSMLPTLVPGERVAFDRLAYLLGPPEPGDIVLARHAARPGVLFIKRVAALPGAGSPDGGYILLGDNQESSTDSRALGPFRRADILGRAWFVYWPPQAVRMLGGPRRPGS